MNTLVIVAVLVFLIGYWRLPSPTANTVQMILAIAGVVLWVLHCVGVVSLPACLT